MLDDGYQGQYKRVLCVCSANLLLSPTAAIVLNKKYKYNTRSAGTLRDALIPVTENLISWADEIVVMEKHHQDWVYSNFSCDWDEKKVLCLNIPDTYSYMDDRLQKLIIKKYEIHRKKL